MRVSLAVLGVFLVAVSGAQWKPPMSKAEEAEKFHPVVPTPPAELRMRAYDQRLRMEAESPFTQLRWRNVGPEIQGGRVIGFYSASRKPDHLFVGFATGGLWRSTDRGQNWTPLFDQESAYAIGHFAVSGDAKTLWVGTGENNSQRTSYSGTGVFKSTDGGQSWRNMGLHGTHRIGKVVIDPRREDTVYVAALGALYSQGPERGVFKTTDGGKTWTHVLRLGDMTGVIDLEMDPRDSKVLYASAWDRDRRAWNFREGGPGSAIYKSSDAGKTWTKLSGGLPASGNLGRIGLALAPSKPDVVYAFMDNQTGDEETRFRDEYLPGGVLSPRRFLLLTDEMFLKLDAGVWSRFVAAYLPREAKADELMQGVRDKKTSLGDIVALMVKRNPSVFEMELANAQVYRSDNGGKTWRRTHIRPIGEHGGYYTGKIVVHPKNPDDLLILGTLLIRSQDGGKTWREVAEDVHVDHHAYWFDPTNPNFQASGNDGGLYFSEDDGQSWTHINKMPVGQFTTIAVDNKPVYNIIGGTQDNGTLKGPNTYVQGRNRPWDWTSIGGGDGSAIAVDPRDGGDTVYLAFQFGMHWGFDQKTGERWFFRNMPGLAGQNLRWNWISPIQISPHHPDILYLGSNKLHRSLNKGRTWEAISDDLTKNRENGDVPHSTLKDISESPLKFGLIYVGTDDGNVRMTMDHGNTWVNIDTPEKQKWVSRVVASRYDKATVYVAQSGYREDDFSAYLWKSTDYGKNWVSIVGDLPAETINVVREDPRNKEWLYVGTDLGVFVTMNGGKNWVPLNGGIPRTPVHDIAIQERERDLVIASHARSIWVFDLDQLYDLTPEIMAKDMYVFPVRNQTRGNWELRRRQEWDPTDGPSPTLAFQVWTKAGGASTVKLVDAKGNVAIQTQPKLAKGFNRISLDLQLKPGRRLTTDPRNRVIKSVEDALADPYSAERGTYLAAGAYTLEITVGDKTENIPWTLEARPGG